MFCLSVHDWSGDSLWRRDTRSGMKTTNRTSVPKSVPEFILPCWEGIKMLKVGITGFILRQYV